MTREVRFLPPGLFPAVYSWDEQIAKCKVNRDLLKTRLSLALPQRQRLKRYEAVPENPNFIKALVEVDAWRNWGETKQMHFLIGSVSKSNFKWEKINFIQHCVFF